MTHSLRRIVVGIGRTDEVDPHLRQALQLAETHGATLYAVHAFRLPDPLLSPYPEMGVYDPDVMRAAQGAVQKRLDDTIAAAGGAARVEARTVPGPADAAIVETAADVGADLIVVGATERGAISRTVLGTTAGRVIRAAEVPVLVNRRGDGGPLRRILMTTDLSDLSGRVFGLGMDFAAVLGSGASPELRTLLVVGDDLATPPRARMTVLQGIAEKELRPFLQRAAPGAAETPGKVRLGDPATEIVAEAEEWGADLLVVGTHGRGGISRFLIGSVAEAVVRQSTCDVLVIPAAAVGADGKS